MYEKKKTLVQDQTTFHLNNAIKATTHVALNTHKGLMFNYACFQFKSKGKKERASLSLCCHLSSWQILASPFLPVTHIDLLHSTFPLEQTSVNPSLCPVQSQPPKGSVCSPTQLQHPRAGTSVNIASPQLSSLLAATESPDSLVLLCASPDWKICQFAL